MQCQGRTIRRANRRRKGNRAHMRERLQTENWTRVFHNGPSRKKKERRSDRKKSRGDIVKIVAERRKAEGHLYREGNRKARGNRMRIKAELYAAEGGGLKLLLEKLTLVTETRRPIGHGNRTIPIKAHSYTTPDTSLGVRDSQQLLQCRDFDWTGWMGTGRMACHETGGGDEGGLKKYRQGIRRGRGILLAQRRRARRESGGKASCLLWWTMDNLTCKKRRRHSTRLNTLSIYYVEGVCGRRMGWEDLWEN